LWIGSQKQELQFIFDTGSPWFWAPTVDCLLCHESDKFDTSLSATFVNTSTSLSTVHYGSGSVYGYRSKDKICVESGSDDFACTLNLQILAVTRTSMLDGMQADGIVGLAPINNSADD
jgi:Eukaryotic aspartyl protease